MQAWQPVDNVCVGMGKTGGNVVIDAPNSGKSALMPSHSINGSFSRDLDFFLIDGAKEYDYILCLVICAAGWVFRRQIGV